MNIVKQLEVDFFDRYVEEGECKKDEEYHTYICKTDEIFRQFPNFFIFDIGDYLISLPKESLIAYKDSELSGPILRMNYNFDYDKENEDTWIFGTWYFQEEIATVFDYDKETFDFFLDDIKGILLFVKNNINFKMY